METDDETDAEESEIDEEMISEESGFAEEVGFLISYHDHDLLLFQIDDWWNQITVLSTTPESNQYHKTI